MYDFKDGLDNQERRFFTLRIPPLSEQNKGRTFYFDKQGVVFGLSEKEASKPPKGAKQVGCSDGSVYNNLIVKAVEDQNESLRKISNPKIKTMAWFRKRQKIADDAKLAANAAVQADIDACRGKIVRPNVFDGQVVGGQLNPMLRMALERRLQR
jgi:hypothetical protein